MKRTLELVSFVSFVSFTMWIILSGVTPAKNTVYKSAVQPSARTLFPSNKMAISKPGLKTVTVQNQFFLTSSVQK